MNQRYLKDISAINRAIDSFNSYLKPDFYIPTFDLNTAIEKTNIVKIIHGDWDGFPFPNNGTRGVYFVFGHEKTNMEKNGLYIGKASFRSTTSGRLYARLHPHRTKEYFSMDGYNEEVYILDYMASVNLDAIGF